MHVNELVKIGDYRVLQFEDWYEDGNGVKTEISAVVNLDFRTRTFFMNIEQVIWGGGPNVNMPPSAARLIEHVNDYCLNLFDDDK